MNEALAPTGKGCDDSWVVEINNKHIQPIDELRRMAPIIEGVFCDIDGTLTDDGRLEPEAYASLWRLHRAGLKLVPVTGRPAGWCDLIVRQWPVDAVIGENGAFAMFFDQNQQITMAHPDALDDTEARLNQIKTTVLRSIPQARLAKDQPYRRYDLAIDYAEDPPHLGLDTAKRIQTLFTEAGAHAKISDIHVNGWFGDYDKASMVEWFAKHHWGIERERLHKSFVYCGDSPNDEPFFARFEHTVGVANIEPFLPELKFRPTYQTQLPGGRGFDQMTQILLGEKER